MRFAFICLVVAAASCAPAVKSPPTESEVRGGATSQWPVASSALALESGLDAPTISLDGERVLVDGVPRGDVHDVVIHHEPAKLPELYAALRERREGWKAAHGEEPFPGVVLVRVDGDVSAAILKSIVQTVAFAGYPQTHLLVHSPDGEVRYFPVDAQVPGPPAAANGGSAGTRVAGRLPPEVIQQTVRAHFGLFRKCYETALVREPTLAGRVTIKFVINLEGKVDSAADQGSTLPDPAVVACVADGFRKLTFPKPEGGIVTVVYPVIFSPGTTP